MTTSNTRIFSDLPTSPGQFLAEELEHRGMTPGELAGLLGQPVGALNEIISGERAITPETAAGLARAMGITAQFWLNLEAKYRATLARNAMKEPASEAELDIR
jgi:HTH-type transcriptional regulator/antitoxin HigA